MKINIGLTDKNREGCVKILNRLLSDEYHSGPGNYPDAKKRIANLLHDHESIIRGLREDLVTCDEKYGDIGTNDFLTGLMERHEKMAWMLRAFLE